MQDLYEEMSDEDDDEGANVKRTDSKGNEVENPFHDQLVKEAQEMKQRQADEARKD